MSTITTDIFMREKALKLILEAIRELNEELEYESLEDANENTTIYGGTEGIDSLSLVSLIVGIEGETDDVFGVRVALADEKAMSQRNSPYRSVGALADFIVARLEAANA